MKIWLVTLAIFTVTLTSGCAVSKERAESAATRNGLTDVDAGRIAIMACGEDDYTFGRKVTATNASGQSIEAIVCCGMLKNCTIRY